MQAKQTTHKQWDLVCLHYNEGGRRSLHGAHLNTLFSSCLLLFLWFLALLLSKFGVKQVAGGGLIFTSRVNVFYQAVHYRTIHPWHLTSSNGCTYGRCVGGHVTARRDRFTLNCYM